MAHRFGNRVLETSVSSGTGVMALTAVEGFERFSQLTGIAIGDTVHYLIQEVNAVGKPLADWEYGRGTYSAANVLTRTTVIESSNANAAVNFAVGTTKQVMATVLAPDTNAQVSTDWRNALDLGKSAVLIDAATGRAALPAGTTAQRPATPGTGGLRMNTTAAQLEYWDGTRWNLLGGPTGGGLDEVFHLNDQLVTTSYAIPSGKNAGSFGPIEIANGVTVDIPNGSVWSIV